jgi:hypothetical protein
MKSLIVGVLACCAALAASSVVADDTPDVLTGRVQGMYVRIEHGIYRETWDPKRYSEVWAEVKTYQLGADRSKGAVLMIRTDSNVERGDIVSFKLADDSYIPISPLPRQNRIVAISAKHGTAIARMYGNSASDVAY